jgi:manganese/zinc/iron transport system permease protein
MPTGPWIVMLISLIAIASLFLSPKKGLVHRAIKRYNNKMKILEENLLKMFYQLGEEDNDYRAVRTVDELQQKRSMTNEGLQKGLKRLMGKGYVATAGDGYTLTDNGEREGQRVTRLHRLWELYLSKYLKLAPDHVHEDAEAIEHVITPEIERKLAHMLDYPNRDPHDTRIPDSE